MNWISVKERMPEWFLLYTTWEDIEVGWRREEDWYIIRDAMGTPDEDITHWMPLPDPPEGDNNE